MPPWVAMSDGGHICSTIMSDRVGVSDGGLVGWFALPARSVLPAGRPDDGCVVSVWLVQPFGWHELLNSMHAVCTGFVCIAGQRRVRVSVPRRLIAQFDCIAVRDVFRRCILHRGHQSGVAMSSRCEISPS